MSKPPRTLVEFVDRVPEGRDPDSNIAHKTQAIYINGEEVLVERDTTVLDFGDNEVTKVTLTILPTEVRFTAKEATE